MENSLGVNMCTGPILYSQIPADQRHEWSNGELSGAIWDEGVHLAGGAAFRPADVAKLPFGFRAVLVEGCVRAHVEGDGLACAIWNDDGVEMFALAADCHRVLGSASLVESLDRIVVRVREWQADGERTPRSLPYEGFMASHLGQWLADQSDAVCTLMEPAFARMMAYLRDRPELF
ncbi:MAG: hypothetical protein ACKVS8_02960 [Phycisphaerales bacterium]